MTNVNKAMAFVFLAATAFSAQAVTILIGDADGFGFVNPNSSWSNIDAPFGLPDTDGDGIIEPGEYLPNVAGSTDVNTSDVFNNQSAAEAAATTGAQHTDRSLVRNVNGSHGRTFTFTFAVPTLGDLDYGVDHFINLVFGDYDVSPAALVVEGTNVPLTLQSSGNDGLVQLGYADVSWADMLDGMVEIEIYAPNEPYLAIDYAYLHTDNTAAPVPAPAGALLLVMGIALMRMRRISR